jgi:hypothetical protein
MTTKFKPVTLDTPGYAIKMTAQTFREIFGGEPSDRPFPAPSSWHPSWYTLQLPCIKRHWEDEGYSNNVAGVTFYGRRSLYRLRDGGGYCLEGRCKVEGKEVSGYTSDIMVEVEGNLYTIAVISIRG